MKSSKNLLMTGVALAITLFASAQIVAMEPAREINPYLNDQRRYEFKIILEDINHSINYFQKLDPKSNGVKYFQNKAKEVETIYYGDKPYTSAVLDNALNLFTLSNGTRLQDVSYNQ